MWVDHIHSVESLTQEKKKTDISQRKEDSASRLFLDLSCKINNSSLGL